MSHSVKLAGVVSILSLACVLQASNAYSWGSYGHQQVNVAAVELLTQLAPSSAATACLNKNRQMIQRLAISPDYDWKKLGTEIDQNYQDVPLSAKKNPDGTRNPNYHSTDPRFATDQFEHPLHFFEADAFTTPDKISELPSGDFSGVQDELIKLRFQADRVAYVKEVDPEKASATPSTEYDPVAKKLRPAEPIDFVREHGTAPWRIKQLLEAGIQNLKSGNVELGLLYLGAMGHYVGDMAQPFHASLNYDGQYDPKGRKPVLSNGIHATFESEMFKTITALPDKTSFLYGSLDVTDAAVVGFAKKSVQSSSLTPVDESQVVSQTFALIASGYGDIQPLLDALWKEMAAAGPVPESRPGKDKPVFKTVPGSVLEVAEKRMGQGAVLLARLWLTAFNEAQKQGPSINCGNYTFDRKKVVESYLKPTYLPQFHQAAAHHTASRTDEGSGGDDNGGGTEPAPEKTPSKPSTAVVRKFRDDVVQTDFGPALHMN